jgi:predicted nucleic acid-binding protein
MEVQTIVDAGPLIGWLNATDQWHGWSVSVLKKVKGPIHTSEIVLGEACWNLGGNTKPVHALLSLVGKGCIRLLRPWPENLTRTQELMLKYPTMDAGDASIVVLSEQNPKARIITTDRADFSIYRRFRSQKIPAIFPSS